VKKKVQEALELEGHWSFCDVEQREPARALPVKLEFFALGPSSVNNGTQFKSTFFARLDGRGKSMKGPKTTLPFRKTNACPSSRTLLSFRSESRSSEISVLVRYHLTTCEFCNAELRLLAHHSLSPKNEVKPPEIPMNLRILAEAILGQNSKMRIL